MLPPDFKRAGWEIYLNIRAAGSSSVRDWINQNFEGDRSGNVWIDLWTTATQIDFRLGGRVFLLSLYVRLHPVLFRPPCAGT